MSQHVFERREKIRLIAVLYAYCPPKSDVYVLNKITVLGFSAPPQPESQKLSQSLLRMYGGRDIALGLMTLAVWARGDRRTLGYTMLASLPIALVDGFVSRDQIGSGEWGHWVFVGIGGALAAGCLELF